MATIHKETESVSLAETASDMRVAIGKHLLIVERTESGGILKLVAADGNQPLEIEITESGPILRLRTGLSVSIEGPVTIAAETVGLHARKRLSLSSDGPIDMQAAGDMSSLAEAHIIKARLGDVRLQANDDVVMLGERIKMNC
jgi:hypothetical protein